MKPQHKQCPPTTVPLRPKRNVKKPKRFMDFDHVDPMNLSDLSSD